MKHNKNTTINAKQIILIPKNDEYEHSINTETERLLHYWLYVALMLLCYRFFPVGLKCYFVPRWLKIS